MPEIELDFFPLFRLRERVGVRERRSRSIELSVELRRRKAEKTQR
jgi:hypothetical protein